MRMMLQGLPPGVQHRNRADLCAEVTRVVGNVAHRIGGRTEQDGVDDALVVERNLGGRRRQGEDHMVVGHRQQLGLTRLKPFSACQTLALRAVPIAAGIVGAADQPAVAVLFDVPAKRGRATGLDRRHDAPLDTTEMRGVIATERLVVAAEDIRHPAWVASSRFRAAASLRGAGGRAGLACRGWCWSPPAYSAPWCAGCCGRATPE